MAKVNNDFQNETLSSVPSSLASLQPLINWVSLSYRNLRKTICFLLHLLIFLLTCCWLFLFCLSLKCWHSFKFYSWPSFILTPHIFLGNPYTLMDSTLTYTWWLSNVCLHPQSLSWAPVLSNCSRDVSTWMFSFKHNLSKTGLFILP